MTETPIFLDYASTSPVAPEVAEAMNACLSVEGIFANPSSTHAAGRRAKAVVDEARSQIGRLVNASADRLVFTSGATEANNLALKGLLACANDSPAHLITSAIEHRSVLDAAHALESLGIGLTRVACDAHGIVAPESVARAIRPETKLVSIMHVNNEIGSVQDVAAIAAVCREADVPLHVDAAQSAGKVPLDIEAWGIDLCSLTAHKVNGPKGIGALYVRGGMTLTPLLHGGTAELGMRAATLPTHQVAGFGKAFEILRQRDESRALAGLRDALWEGIASIPGARRNGDPSRSAPHILSVTFPGVEGESLKLALADISVSAGSACTSRDPEPSHVLRSLGMSDTLAESTLRFGVGRFTTPTEISTAVGRIRAEVRRLRELAADAPGWCST